MHPLPPTLLALCLSAPLGASAQFAGDNVRYRTITWEEFPRIVSTTPSALVLDVRSPGEYADTSIWAGLNIGHVKGAVNIDVDEVGKRLSELPADRNAPIVVYCSHSQRSRHVSNLLADSGYTHVMNVNGGLSRYWTERQDLPQMDALVQRKWTFGLLNAQGLCALIGSRPAVLLDVRPASVPASDPAHARTLAYGHWDGAVHIPLDALAARTAELPRDRAIVIVDEDGAGAPKAAMLLTLAGFSDVHVLFNGLEAAVGLDQRRFPCKGSAWRSDAPFGITDIEQLDTAAILSGKAILLDVRPTEEYEGTAKEPWRNVGRYREAKHITAADIPAQGLGLDPDKTRSIIVAGSGPDDALYGAALALAQQGYTNVTVLVDGLWRIRWVAHNLAGRSAWAQWVVPFGPK